MRAPLSPTNTFKAGKSFELCHRMKDISTFLQQEYPTQFEGVCFLFGGYVKEYKKMVKV
jgi:hypothetical protein